MGTANIRAVISAEDRASKVLVGFGQSTQKLGKSLAIGLAAATAATAAFAVSAVKSFTESQNVMAQTNAVIKSTGGVAGVTSKQVSDLASSLQRVTKFSDEQVQSGENLLLTFTKIGKNIFPQATEVMLDMSQALGQDVKNSAIQLGKALQDPILGITALRRVGVNFNDEQKKVIENLVKTGRSAEAQKLILKELQTEFGGSARAAGQTFAGQLTILKNQLDDIKETIGLFIAIAITPLVKGLAEVANKIDWENVINKTNTAVRNFWRNELVPFAQKVSEIARTVGEYLLPKFEALWNTISTRLIPALNILWKNVIQPLIPVIGTALVVAFGLAVDAINAAITVLSPLISWLGRNKEVVWGLIGAITAWYTIMKVTAGFNALYNSIALARARLFGLQVQAGSTRGAFILLNRTLSTPITISILVGAALIALQKVYDSAKKTLAVMDALNKTLDQNSASTSSAMNRAQAGLKAARARGDKAAEARYMTAIRSINSAYNGFASGGFTGRGGTNEVAGVVHKGEYVLPQNMVDQNTGRPKLGSNKLSLNVNIGIYAGTEIEKRRLAQELLDAMSDIASRKSMTLGEMIS